MALFALSMKEVFEKPPQVSATRLPDSYRKFTGADSNSSHTDDRTRDAA
jgi:hypothetical protein